MTPSLRAVMTTHPHSIRIDETVQTARRKMTSLGVRHLPVLEAGALRGVVSDRDLRLVPGEGADVTIEDVCVDDPIAVDIDTSVFVVVSLMADTRVGSVLVTEDDRVCGIFTTTDACRMLSQLLDPRRERDGRSAT